MHGLKRTVLAMLIAATPMSAGETVMELNPDWEYVADTVMGGVSKGQLSRVAVAGRDAVRLTGDVSLENNGGFIQMASDLGEGGVFDASDWNGIEVDLKGVGEGYELRLRTDQLTRPWQSYRVVIEPTGDWETFRFDWAAFEARKTDVAFDPARLRRMGILAIGAEMQADIAVSGIRFYK
jgi:hypothetical protein